MAMVKKRTGVFRGLGEGRDEQGEHGGFQGKRTSLHNPVGTDTSHDALSKPTEHTAPRGSPR